MALVATHVTREVARSSYAGLSSLHDATLPDRGRREARKLVETDKVTFTTLRTEIRGCTYAVPNHKLGPFREGTPWVPCFGRIAFTTGLSFMRLAKNTFAAIVAASWFVVAHAGAQTPPNPAPTPTTSPPFTGSATAPAPVAPGTAPAPKPMQPAPVPGQTPVVPGQPPAMDGQTYAIHLRDLEQRIDDLKEQIRRSHTRLSLLSDTILAGGSGGGSRAIIKFSNEISTAWRISKLLIVLDGSVQYSKTEQQGVIADAGEVPVFTGTIPPGAHTVQVLVNLTGTGFGVFSYLKGYKFEIRSDHSFTSLEGKTSNINVVSFEKGGATARFEERPAVRYSDKVTQGLGDLPAAGAPGAAR